MRILIADKLAPFVPERLQDLGAEAVVDPGVSGDALGAKLAQVDPEVLIVRSTRVEAAHLEAASSLALVIRAGAGVNTIDVPTASAGGIYVANCPGKNAAAVAELAMAHLLNLDRRVSDNVAALRAHTWDKKGFSAARGLKDRTLAVLGVGRIGQEVIARARAFGMRVVAWSRTLDETGAAELGVTRAATPEEAVRDADAVSVHLALTPETRGRIGQSVFEAMKPGALFVNTARGEVVDQAALLRAASERGLRAGLDVFAEEPGSGRGEFTDPIADHPSVYGTHHIGASTEQAEEAVGEEVLRIVEAFRDGREIPNCVNLASRSAATHMVVVRHRDEVGVLAGILDVLSEAGHNVEEMQNVVFSGARAAVARIAVVGEPERDTLRRLAAAAAVLSATASPLG